jgi:autoinducer 2 (AI-2) kinase
VGEFVVALDAGIGGGRSLVCDALGRVVATVYREWSYDSSQAIAGASVFDAERFWLDLCAATREAMARGDVRPQAVRAISATSQREGLVMVDSAGRVLHALSSIDARGKAENEALALSHGQLVYSTAGRRPNAIHTPGRLRWFLHNDPEALEATRYFFMIDSWLAYRMSGIAAIEPSSASASLLFDVAERRWSPALCSLAGVREDTLPAVGASGQVIGALLPRAAQDLGLPPGTPVVLGGGDGQCGLLGLGVVDPGCAAAIAGTTTPMLFTVAEPRFDAQERTWTQCLAAPPLWAVEANAGSTGLSYRWIRDLLWSSPAGPASTDAAFDAMHDAAAGVQAGSQGIRVYLGPNGMDPLRSEILQRTVTIMGARIDGSATEARAAITRATLECIAFGMRSNWDLLCEVTGQTMPVLHVGGGQARGKLWRSLVADVLGVPLHVGIPEAAALGAAMCAWVGAGRAADVASVSREFADYVVEAPRPAEHERYEALYAAWLAGRP